MSSDYGIIITGPGVDALDSVLTQQGLNSTTDRTKIFATGTLTLSLPSETLSVAGGSTPNTSVHTASFNHALGYVPMFTPMANLMQYRDSGGNLDPSSTDDFYVNDEGTEQVALNTGSLNVYIETIQIYATSANLTIEVERFFLPPFPPGSYDFGAHDIIVDYAVFYNRVDEAISYVD